LNLLDSNLATEAEKQILLDAMHAKGKDWDAEKCEVVDYVEKIKVGQKLYFITITNGRFITISTESNEDRAYKNYEFKTEALAKAACDKLNETIKTLKHY
jgi:hypothetical protein